MKTMLLVAVLSLGASVGSAQSTIAFNNRVIGRVIAPVFGPQVEDNTVTLHGNGPDPSLFFPTDPAGPTYTGARLEGDGYTAQLVANVFGSWVPLASTTFLSGAGAGFVRPVDTVVFPGGAVGQPLLLQVRVWENRALPGDSRADIVSWEGAVADPTVLRGFSIAFEVNPLVSRELLGLRSFSLAVPEPSTLALGSLMAVSLLSLHRRRSRR